MSYEKATVFILMCFALFMGFIFGCAAHSISDDRKHNKNLKCVQGELYEEIKNNVYVKSHLECFEQKTLLP